VVNQWLGLLVVCRGVFFFFSFFWLCEDGMTELAVVVSWGDSFSKWVNVFWQYWCCLGVELQSGLTEWTVGVLFGGSTSEWFNRIGVLHIDASKGGFLAH
jgi:hypothetical protein